MTFSFFDYSTQPLRLSMIRIFMDFLEEFFYYLSGHYWELIFQSMRCSRDQDPMIWHSAGGESGQL